MLKNYNDLLFLIVPGMGWVQLGDLSVGLAWGCSRDYSSLAAGASQKASLGIWGLAIGCQQELHWVPCHLRV